MYGICSRQVLKGHKAKIQIQHRSWNLIRVKINGLAWWSTLLDFAAFITQDISCKSPKHLCDIAIHWVHVYVHLMSLGCCSPILEPTKGSLDNSTVPHSTQQVKQRIPVISDKASFKLLKEMVFFGFIKSWCLHPSRKPLPPLWDNWVVLSAPQIGERKQLCRADAPGNNTAIIHYPVRTGLSWEEMKTNRCCNKSSLQAGQVSWKRCLLIQFC